MEPDETGFYLTAHSWVVLRDPPGPVMATRIGDVLYGEPAASGYARLCIPDLAKRLKNDKLAKKLLVQAAEQDGILRQKSWRLEGTYSKTKKRPQTVTSDWDKAVEILKEARRKEAGLADRSPKELISQERAVELLSVEEKLTKRKWKLTQIVELAEKVNFDPNLPDISISDAIEEYLEWAESQTRIPAGSDDVRPKISPETYKGNARSLEIVRRYFKETEPLMKLMDMTTVQAFCTGTDEIPKPKTMTENQARPQGRTAFGNTVRPWNPPTVRAVATAINALLRWASTPGISHRNGVRAYLPQMRKEDYWWPDRDDGQGAYLRDAKTGTPYEYRSWIDTAWPTRFAAQVALEVFAGLRPAEIHAPDSYINWEECHFWVGRSCKTGHRKVPLCDNLMTMLFALKFEGRLDLSWDRKRHPRALTRLHGKMGYAIAESSIRSSRVTLEMFRKDFPLRFHKVTNKTTGKDEVESWGEWTVKGPRHTFGSVVYEASMCNAGVTAGILGHKESTFLENYAGKVHAELWHGSVYRACLSFIQCLPKQLRALGLRERDMSKPAWFLIQPDDRRGDNRERLLNLVKRAQASNEIIRRQVAAVEKEKTFIPTQNEMSVRLGVDIATLMRWRKRPDFPQPTSKGFVLEDVLEWARQNDLPKPSGPRSKQVQSITERGGKTAYVMLRDLAKALGVSDNTLTDWRERPTFPKRVDGAWVLEEVQDWVNSNIVVTRRRRGNAPVPPATDASEARPGPKLTEETNGEAESPNGSPSSRQHETDDPNPGDGNPKS